MTLSKSFFTAALFCFALLAGCGEKQGKETRVFKGTDSAEVINEPAHLIEKKEYIVDPDSVQIEHTARFGKHKYEGDQYKTQDAVFFKLKVTNKGKTPIPDIQTARKNGIGIVVNGNGEIMFMTLANFASGEDHTLAKDSSDTWEMDFEITGPQPVGFGNPFTFQWNYIGISSEILEADIKKRTIKKVEHHRPDNFSNQ